MKGAVYFDHAATVPLDPRVATAMAACLTDPDLQANPASAHAAGRAAAERLAAARLQVASLVNAPPEAIVLTSGATESVNLAVLGAVRGAGPGRRHVVTSRIEHRAGLEACRQLEREGHDVAWLAPGGDGLIRAEQVEAALREDTTLVSLMHANNETGVLTDIATVAGLCEARGIAFHVDAAQSAGKVPVDAALPGIALLSFCAHKLGGPKGVGALYVRRRPRPPIQPLHYGGGQERGLRSGTLALHQAVGFGLACELARAALGEEPSRIRALRERLWGQLQAAAPAWRNGAAEPSLPGILSVGFAGIEGESLLLQLDGEVAAASGAACNSASGEPSHVLRALGRSDEAIQASLRLSLGRSTTAEDVDRAAAAILHAVGLRLGRSTTAEDVDRAAAAIVHAVARLRAALPVGALERIA